MVSIAFTGAAATIVVGMTPTQAMATSTWHVKNGATGFHGGPGAVKGKLKAGTKATLKDVTTGDVLQCDTASVAGSVPASRVVGKSPTVAKVSQLNSSRCFVGGGNLAFVMKANKVMDLHAVTYNAATGITKGYLGTKGVASAVSLKRTGASVSNHCRASITGSMLPVSYRNGTRSLVIDAAHVATLKVKSVAGCFLQSNDLIYLSGRWHITVPAALKFSK